MKNKGADAFNAAFRLAEAYQVLKMVREIFLLGSLDLGGAVTALAFWQLHGVKIKKFVADLGPKSAKVVKDNAAVIASFIVGTLGGETAATDKLPNNEQDNRKKLLGAFPAFFTGLFNGKSKEEEKTEEKSKEDPFIEAFWRMEMDFAEERHKREFEAFKNPNSATDQHKLRLPKPHWTDIFNSGSYRPMTEEQARQREEDRFNPLEWLLALLSTLGSFFRWKRKPKNNPVRHHNGMVIDVAPAQETTAQGVPPEPAGLLPDTTTGGSPNQLVRAPIRLPRSFNLIDQVRRKK